MQSLQFDLVTPQAVFFSGAVKMVEAPGTLGDFGVLAGHMPFISTLKAGKITIHQESGNQSRLFVAGGIAEVNAAACTILAEQVVDLASFTRADAEARLAKAKSAQQDAFDDNARQTAEREVKLAEALLTAVA